MNQTKKTTISIHAAQLPSPDGDALLGALTRSRLPRRGAKFLARVATRVERAYAREVSRSANVTERLDLRQSAAQRLLCAAAVRISSALEAVWARRPLGAVKLDDETPHTPTAERYAAAAPDTLAPWLRLAEDLVGSHVVIYLCHVFMYLRAFLSFVTVAMLLVLLACLSYPFQPQRMLMFLAWSSIGGVTIGSVIVFVQLEHDEVLSRLSKTRPGKVSWERGFILRVVVYVALPLLGLVAAEFPSVGRVLFSWVGPALRILH
jgi:hypothetical protein